MGVYYYELKGEKEQNCFPEGVQQVCCQDKSQRRLHRAVFSRVVLDTPSTGMSHSPGKEHTLYELIKEKSTEEVVELFYKLSGLT